MNVKLVSNSKLLQDFVSMPFLKTTKLCSRIIPAQFKSQGGFVKLTQFLFIAFTMSLIIKEVREKWLERDRRAEENCKACRDL